MKNFKWLTVTIALTSLFLLIVVSVNFYIDTYGVRLSLFSLNKKTEQIKCMEDINQHIFNPEFVFRNPYRFDSFLFGSSRIAVIDPGKIGAGKFYNMSYSQGLPAEHLLMVKAFLQKGIKIKSVVVGLDEFSFTVSPQAHKNELLRIMHPYITGNNLPNIFFTYYFRTPKLFELANGRKLLFNDGQEEKFILDEKGLNLFWIKKEKQLKLLGKPLFTNDTIKSSPNIFNAKLVDEAFTQIEELILLARKNNFSLIFFFNPLNNKLYTEYANSLFPVKLRLALLTDFYDFSGLNSITLNNFNYYEESHYRYLVGDMIVKRIFGYGNINVPEDFGVLVTKENVKEHIEKQKLELNKYLVNQGRKS